jgi:carboxymethylenebutenolidase
MQGLTSHAQPFSLKIMPMVTVPVPNASSLTAYLAGPVVAKGPQPGVVVIHDLFGLGLVTQTHADRLATAGYLALAPDLYSRGGAARCLVATFRAATAGRGQAYQDIAACRSWLEQQDGCTGRIGIVGFCMGGSFALVAATQDFHVSAVNYGHLPGDINQLRTACPIVASYGRKDRGLGTAGDQLEAALDSFGVECDVKTYANVGHSFLDAYNLGPFTPIVRVAGFGYDHATAEHAWRRILNFFDSRLSQPTT